MLTLFFRTKAFVFFGSESEAFVSRYYFVVNFVNKTFFRFFHRLPSINWNANFVNERLCQRTPILR